MTGCTNGPDWYIYRATDATTSCTWNDSSTYSSWWTSSGTCSATTTTCNEWKVWYKLDKGTREVYPRPKTASERLAAIIAGRHAPAVIGRNKALAVPQDIREQRARETLRRVIGSDRYFDFLRKGFVSVRGKSGLVYQIFPAHGITKVFDQGKLVERLCVVLSGNFPPTDSVIMRYLLILNDETMFRAKAIKHSVDGMQAAERPKLIVEPKALTEIYRELKALQA